VAGGVVGVVGTPLWHALGASPHGDKFGAFFAFAFVGDAISDSIWQRLGRRGRLPAWALVPARKGEPRPSLIEDWRAHRYAVQRAANRSRDPNPGAYPGPSDVTYRARNTWSGDNGVHSRDLSYRPAQGPSNLV
jgi:hypothetical protein